MFGLSQRERDAKSLKQLLKNRNKIEPKVIKKISKRLDSDETILGIVAYRTYNNYIVKTSKGRFFVGGIQNKLKIAEMILTRDKIISVSKDGLLPANIKLELINGNIVIVQEANIAKVEKLYMDIVNLVG
ncbi:MAG: hypothetical protein KIB00_17390 [Paeniclostridium sordellii]|nr:hypothetical protein [Paeniclostridium sordellii]